MAPTPSQAPPSSKSICEFFFTAVTKVEWQCNKCSKVKSKNGGWTNLLSHTRTCVGIDYEKVFLDHKKVTKSSTMSGFFVRVSEQEKQMHQWIQFIVMKNLPVSFVDCTYTRNISRLKQVSGRTVRRHILSLLDVLKDTLRRELPSRFVLVFDGWSEGTQHYIGVAAAYMKTVDGGKEIPVQTMLSMKPLLSDGIQGMRAVDHIEHLEKVLNSYGKKMSDVICLVGDNCSVNQSMARIMKVPLLGCASHKFNLAVRRWIDEQPDLSPIIKKVRRCFNICVTFAVYSALALVMSSFSPWLCSLVCIVASQVGRLMKKASTLKIASQLRDLTSYCPVKENDTRWSSAFNMIGRFLTIEKELGSIADLLSLLPNHLEVDVLKRAFASMEKFDSITNTLQRNGMSFVESREMFDLFLKDYPMFEHYIGDEALIIENELFEKTVMRIARGLQLSDEQRRAAVPLLKPDEDETPHDDDGCCGDDDETNDETQVSYAVLLQRKLKRQKRVSASEGPGVYINLEQLPGTSVNCERLFSAAKFILSDTRKRTSPTLFEALLLLKVNAESWNVFSVGEAMGRSYKKGNGGNSIDMDVDELDESDSGGPELASSCSGSSSSSSISQMS